MTSGKDLKLARIAADVKQKDLAAAMGVPQNTVTRWESRRIVAEETAILYLAALATFATSTDTPSAA